MTCFPITRSFIFLNIVLIFITFIPVFTNSISFFPRKTTPVSHVVQIKLYIRLLLLAYAKWSHVTLIKAIRLFQKSEHLLERPKSTEKWNQNIAQKMTLRLSLPGSLEQKWVSIFIESLFSLLFYILSNTLVSLSSHFC